MAMIKLILTDIDGTLVTDDKILLDENRKALEQAIERGVYVTLVTGRHFSYAKFVLDELGLDVPIVLQNGAFIYRPLARDIIRSIYLSGVIARSLIEASREEGLFYFVSSDFLEERDILLDQDYEGPYGVYLQRNSHRINRVTDVLKYLPDQVGEIAFLGPEEKVLRVLKTIESFTGYSVVKSLLKEAGPFYEVYGPRVGKAESLSFLCDYFKVKTEEVMYIGDAYNDLDIMSLVGYPVAMGNSVPEVKRIASLVTRSNNEAGVAWAVKELVLEQ